MKEKLFADPFIASILASFIWNDWLEFLPIQNESDKWYLSYILIFSDNSGEQ